MKFRLPLIATLTLCCIISISFINEDEALKTILSKLERFSHDYPQEKVHLHLDKPFYAIGDDIWFKAYVVDGESHQLSGLSKVLNVELINENDSVTQSLRLPLVAGLALGDFQLADHLSEGNYRIRAYTNYMRNFDDAFFFDKTFKVGNAISSDIISTVNYHYEKQKILATMKYERMDGQPLAERKVNYVVQLGAKQMENGVAITDSNGEIRIGFTNSDPVKLKSGKINTVLMLDDKKAFKKSFLVKYISNETDVQFFPEGGSQVYGIRSRVAFKALGADGLGKNIRGTLFSTTGEKILDFSTTHGGMGFLAFKPMVDQTYFAEVKFEDGSTKKVPLPLPQKEGFVLSANNIDSNNLSVKISASPSIATSGNKFTLIAQQNGVPKFVSQTKLDQAVFVADIPKSRFATGILQLTLFNGLHEPVAERLVFINHHDFLQIKVNGPSVSASRKKVKLDLDVKDLTGQPILGSFSVSVTDAKKVQLVTDEETTILSNLLLTSDLKGYVEKPNYYFSDNDPRKVEDLDNLMLTQGWRRFTWKDLLSDRYPNMVYKYEDGITISGRVTKNKKPVSGGKVTLMSPKGRFFVLDTITDSEGRFAFNHLTFADSTSFVVQARTAKGKETVDIVIDDLPPQKMTRNPNFAEVVVNVNQSLLLYLKNSANQFGELRRANLNKTIQLAEVNIVERKLKKIEGSANLGISADVIFTAEDLEKSPSIGLDQFLIGRVAGLEIKDSIPYLTRYMYSSLTFTTPMMLLVDGVRVPPETLADINPQELEGVEILKGASAAIYGMLGGGGVLLVTSKRSKGAVRSNDDIGGILHYMPKAYYQAREFYSPNYENPKTNVQEVDLRTTLYWNPNLIVKNGKASFEFYNSDAKGPCTVVFEGIDVKGHLARYVYSYIVN